MSIESMLMVEPDTRSLPKQPEVDHPLEYLGRLMEVVDNGVWLIDKDLCLVAQNEMVGKSI